MAVLAVVVGLVVGLVFAVRAGSKWVDRRLDEGRIRTFAGYYAQQREGLDEMTVPQLAEALRIVWNGFPINPMGRPEPDSPLWADYERDRDAMVATLIEHLRGRFEEGEAWTAIAIADWSEDPDDFRRIRESLATEKDPRKRQSLVNAFTGDRTLVRERADEARAVLISVLGDPAEDPSVRGLARDFLASSFGPMDEASAEAVSRYDAEQKGR